VRAGYTVVRLNGSEPVFTEWIQRAFPDRAQKVLNRVRDVHGGRLNDSTLRQAPARRRHLGRVHRQDVSDEL
jgi:hypothetical protein